MTTPSSRLVDQHTGTVATFRDADAAELERLRDENSALQIRADELWTDLQDTRGERDRARERVRHLVTELATASYGRDTARACSTALDGTP